jgi:uroporphyrinogen-III synthase
MPTQQSRSRNAPLQGYRIALTTSNDDPISPAEDLAHYGAKVLYYPVAQHLPPDSFDALDSALTRGQRSDATWLILSTPCAVEAVQARMNALSITTADLQNMSIAVFGAKTQLAVAKLLPGLPISVAQSQTHGQFVDELQLTPDDTVVVLLAQYSRADWTELIAVTGAKADAVPAYRLILGRGGDDLPGLLWEGKVDGVLFLTENSVRHFAIRLKVEGGTLDMLNDVDVFCFDNASTDAARAFGLTVRLTLPPDVAHAPAGYLANQIHAVPISR